MRRRRSCSCVLLREGENGATAGGLARAAERCVEIFNGGVALRGIKNDDGRKIEAPNCGGQGWTIRGGIDRSVVGALQGHQRAQKRKIVKLVPDIAGDIRQVAIDESETSAVAGLH